MSTLSIQPTYPIFTDIDGQPLEDGFIWIGEANLDPQTNPIDVYWDAALTIPAAQPIRTLAGYPSNSGTPGRLYVNSDYSIRVMNKNGSVVYGAPAATGRYPANAASTVYDPAGVGAVSTTVQTVLRQTITPTDFGAVGDGITDDTVAVQAANIHASSVGGRLIFPTGTYRLTDSIVFEATVEMIDGAVLSCADDTKAFIFSRGFVANLTPCIDTDAFVQFLSVEKIYPQWFGAMGDAVFARCSVSAGSSSVTVFSPGGLTGGDNGFTDGDTVYINGAGAAGSVLSATIVSGGGTGTMVISAPAATTVSGKSIATRNDTVALQRFFASVKAGTNSVKYGTNQPSTNGCNKLYVPFGTYCSFDEITCYGNTLLEGEFAVPLGGARIVHCNIAKPLINVLADNFDASGSSTNGGNNNNIIRHIGFSGAEIDDSQTNPPLINYQYAWNTHSDCELDHVLWQNTAGACVSGGFSTTGTISAGSTTLTMADGSVFRNGDYGGGRITIVGAGTAGANLEAYIVSGGGTNTVTISTPAITSVSDAVIFPQSDLYSLKVHDCEMDVCRAGFNFVGNSSGSLVINNLLAFWVVRGALRVFSVGAWDVMITDSKFLGCGSPYNATDLSWVNSVIIDSEYEGSLLIDSCVFKKSSSFGGRIYYKGERFTFRNNQFEDPDSAFYEKFLSVRAAHIAVQNNLFRSLSIASYTNARMISLSYTGTEAVLITGNTFENANASSYEYFIQSNYVLDVCNIVGNSFRGNAIGATNANVSDQPNTIVLNRGYNPVQRYGSSAPVTGTWGAGDMVWNTAPVASGKIGWICVTAGTPGTWKAFGSINP